MRDANIFSMNRLPEDDQFSASDQSADQDDDAIRKFKWLGSAEAELPLQQTQALFLEDVNPLKIARMLRKSLTPQFAALVMEQAQLRIRARRKFADADRMFFTGRSLEQSTSTLLANYKAIRFADLQSVADICCGIGGDLLALGNRLSQNAVSNSERFETVGVDRDPIAAQFAQLNARTIGLQGVRSECAEFENFDVSRFEGVHLDPDRRVKSRTVVGNFFQPSLESVFQKVDPSRQLIAIKVAPATKMDDFDFPVQREWIGDRRECKQQVVWCGPQIEQPLVRATVIEKDSSVHHFASTDARRSPLPKIAADIGPFLYEPHACVLAAGLLNCLAKQHELQILSHGVAFLNSDRALTSLSPILNCYRVDGVYPMDVKVLAKELNLRDVGKLVLKKRGVDQVIADRIARIKLKGSNKATLVLTRHNSSRRAILVTRLKSSPPIQ